MASDDEDVLLVQISLQIADTYATVMIAEYMDLLVLLLLSTLPSNCHDVYIVPGRTNASNIQRCQEDTGPWLCHNILFAHAYGAVRHHCMSVRHQQECTPEETICR